MKVAVVLGVFLVAFYANDCFGYTQDAVEILAQDVAEAAAAAAEEGETGAWRVKRQSQFPRNRGPRNFFRQLSRQRAAAQEISRLAVALSNAFRVSPRFLRDGFFFVLQQALIQARAPDETQPPPVEAPPAAAAAETTTAAATTAAAAETTAAAAASEAVDTTTAAGA